MAGARRGRGCGPSRPLPSFPTSMLPVAARPLRALPVCKRARACVAASLAQPCATINTRSPSRSQPSQLRVTALEGAAAESSVSFKRRSDTRGSYSELHI